MAIKPLSSAEIEQASQDIENGNLNFQVTRGEVAPSGAQQLLIWSQLATRRKPNFLHRALSVGGNPTRFGNAVFYALLPQSGIEPSLDDVDRQLVHVHVKDGELSDDGPMRYQRKGLPLKVAVIIQAMVNRHS